MALVTSGAYAVAPNTPDGTPDACLDTYASGGYDELANIPSRAPTTNNSATLHDGLVFKTNSNPQNVLYNKFGTGSGNNIQTPADLQAEYWSTTLAGFGGSALDGDNPTFGAAWTTIRNRNMGESTSACNTTPLRSGYLSVQARGSGNDHHYVANQWVMGGMLRAQPNITPGSVISITWEQPEGEHSWLAWWLFGGYQARPPPGGHPFDNADFSHMYCDQPGKNTLQNPANLFWPECYYMELDITDGFKIDKAVTPEYKAANNISAANTMAGISWVDNVQTTDAAYQADGVVNHCSAYPTDFYRAHSGTSQVIEGQSVPTSGFYSGSPNLTAGKHNLVLNIRKSENKVDWILDGQLVHSANWCMLSYMANLNGTPTEIGMHLMLTQEAVPFFHADVQNQQGPLAAVTNNDGLSEEEGWAGKIYEMQVWKGELGCVDYLRPDNRPPGTCSDVTQVSGTAGNTGGSGSSTTYNWTPADLPRSNISGGQFHYTYLLPPGYGPSNNKFPVVFWLGKDNTGNAHYTGANATDYLPGVGGGSNQPDAWFNNTPFRTNYPAIVVLPYLDQTCGNVATCNSGGVNDTPGSQANEQALIALAQYFTSNFNVDPNRIYVTGDESGANGTEALMFDANIYNGPVAKVFAAGVPFGGELVPATRWNDTATLARMASVPLFAWSGGTDALAANTNRPLWAHYAGNVSYPAPPGGQAGNSHYWYSEDSSLGRDVWDTYRTQANAAPWQSWLFAQTASGSSSSTTGNPTGVALPSGYLTASGSQIIDGSGLTVRISSINYPTVSTSLNVDMARMRALGFNAVRYPWYDRTQNFTTMDSLVNAAAANNMKVIFVHQGNETPSGTACASRQLNGSWFDLNGSAPWTTSNNTNGCGSVGTVTYNTFKTNTVSLAAHYNGNTTVIALDLHNQPNGTWGDGSGTDVKAMCQDTGGVVNTVNSGVLVMCEAPYNSAAALFNGTVNATGVTPDLSKVATSGVSIGNKVVYVVNEYPCHSSGTCPDNGAQKTATLSSAWGNVVSNSVAPVMVVLGANMDNSDGFGTADASWASTLVPYINGQSGISGGPTFGQFQQAISTSWATFTNNTALPQNGILAADGSFRSGQESYWSTLLFQGSMGTAGSAGGGGTQNPTGTTTWNPSDQVNMTLSSGNLVTTSAVNHAAVRSSTGKSSGKWCAQVTLNTMPSFNGGVGLDNGTEPLTGFLGGAGSQGAAFYPNYNTGQTIYQNGVFVVSGASPSTDGEGVTIAVDVDAKKWWVSDSVMVAASQTWNNSGTADPATGAGGIDISYMTAPFFVEATTQDMGTVFTGKFVVPSGCPTGFQSWDSSPISGHTPTVVIFAQ